MVIANLYHIAPQDPFDFFFDCYCGGGGSGSGILRAFERLGRKPYGTFVNHWDRAIEIHGANHPEHRHMKEDLFLLNPEEMMPTDVNYSFGWASPSCQQFSLSRGNRPINEQGRSHADTVVEWMAHCRPEGQIVENVKQFRDWCRLKQRRDKKNELCWAKEVPNPKKKGKTKIVTFHGPKHPLPQDHKRAKGEPEAEWELRMITLGYDRHLTPDMDYRGEYFNAWVEKVKALGYYADWKLIRSADHGDPTIRERLFVQFARIDSGKRICWPDQRFLKPGARRPVFKVRNDRPLLPWPTARDNVIEWRIKGISIFLKDKALAHATMRRIAIGLVKFGLKEFFVPASNFGGEALVESFILPKDQGHKADYVSPIRHPLPAVQTTAHDHLVEPFISHLRSDGNTGEPLRALTASGQHQLLAEAFLLCLDNAGKNGAGQRAYSVDEPVKTIPVKANQTLAQASLEPVKTGARFTLATLEDCVRKVAPKGADTSRVIALLEPLMTELKKAGRIDIRPWVYVYYGSGAVGADIDTPMPTIRCKEGSAVCYPVLEFDGQFLLLDVLYRMLTVRELQRAQGFSEEFVWPEGITKSDIVKAIGNSVSSGVAEALTLAWYSQNEDISHFFTNDHPAPHHAVA